MEFKEITHKAPSIHSAHLDEIELFWAVKDGYYYDGYTPLYMVKVFDFEGDYKKARVSKRLVKLWCKKMSKIE